MNSNTKSGIGRNISWKSYKNDEKDGIIVYMISMVLHDQDYDMERELAVLEESLANIGWPEHGVHAGNTKENDVFCQTS